jgi:hypothetical protein
LQVLSSYSSRQLSIVSGRRIGSNVIRGCYAQIFKYADAQFSETSTTNFAGQLFNEKQAQSLLISGKRKTISLKRDE